LHLTDFGLFCYFDFCVVLSRFNLTDGCCKKVGREYTIPPLQIEEIILQVKERLSSNPLLCFLLLLISSLAL